MFVLQWFIMAATATPLTNVGPPPVRNPISDPMPTAIYPIGFSREGAFAWIRERPDEAIGCFLWSFEIVDLVTDKPLHSQRWSEEGCEAIGDMKALQAKHGRGFDAALRKHGIVAAKVSQLEAVPFTTGEKTFDVRLVSGPGAITTPGEVKWPVAVRVRDGAGEKTVGTVHIEALAELPMIWGHEPLGVLVSPHEARAVVFVQHEQRGWEGPPNTLQIEVFGVDLDGGFKAR